MTIEQKRRELFEAWASDGGKWPKAVKRTADNQYLLAITHSYWIAFNAALDAVVIELPESLVPIDAQERGWEMMGNFRAAIESTGLGLKVKP